MRKHKHCEFCGRDMPMDEEVCKECIERIINKSEQKIKKEK